MTTFSQTDDAQRVLTNAWQEPGATISAFDVEHGLRGALDLPGSDAQMLCNLADWCDELRANALGG
jgi:hypothetical protein